MFNIFIRFYSCFYHNLPIAYTWSLQILESLLVRPRKLGHGAYALAPYQETKIIGQLAGTPVLACQAPSSACMIGIWQHRSSSQGQSLEIQAAAGVKQGLVHCTWTTREHIYHIIWTTQFLFLAFTQFPAGWLFTVFGKTCKLCPCPPLAKGTSPAVALG